MVVPWAKSGKTTNSLNRAPDKLIKLVVYAPRVAIVPTERLTATASLHRQIAP